MSRDNLHEEYKDVSENIRHWQNMRFAQLTVFIALTAGIFAAVYHKDFDMSAVTRLLTKIGGATTVAMFWLMDERVVQYWKTCRNRAVELEKSLGYNQYGSSPSRSWLTAGNAIRLFYFFQLLFWIFAALIPVAR